MKMCRLFGLTGGTRRVTATFWLLDATDSLSEQSHREPDGTGLGSYDAAGRPVVSKQPIAAYEDRQFAQQARKLHSRTFIAHIRYASTGANKAENTHPFEIDGRLFAHNGVITELDRLEQQLGDELSLVQGDTDSERFFALIMAEARRGAGIGDAIASAAAWIAAELPVYALNCILISGQELWALRYPETHELYVLERAAGGPTGDAHLHHRGEPGTVRVHSEHLAELPSVVVASEPMDDDPGWRGLDSGELLHVDRQLNATVTKVLDRPPARQLTLADLDPKAAASQQKAGAV